VGAAAVCVWNTEATRVWAPAAIVAFTSGVGSPAAGCPAQDARKIPMSNNEIDDRRAKYIIHLTCEFRQSYRLLRLIRRDCIATTGREGYFRINIPYFALLE